METRLLHTDTPESPSLSVAIDEAILDEVTRGFSPQTLRFFRCERAVFIGKSNTIEESIDMDVARKNNVSVARRFFESEASYHDIGVLNFSFIANTSALGNDLSSAFSTMVQCTANALKEPGVELDVASSLILLDGNKVFDSRITAIRGAMLFAGFVFIDSDTDLHQSVLRKRGLDSAMSAPANIGSVSKRTAEDIRRAISDSFAKDLGTEYVMAGLTEDELAITDRIQWKRHEKLL
jgi:lipoate-protein ligase A